jgi:RNA polymerase sigma factor (TIGR02999 family)
MEPAAPATDTTQLLLAARDGRSEATERLFAHLYEELRALAHLHLSAHRPLATLETGGLLHEAYLRLVDRGRITPADRAHFFAIAAQAMRFVLLDRARARQRQKRGGRAPDLPLEEALAVEAADHQAAELLALDRALDHLRSYSERLAEVVEYRFFGGLTYEEIAALTDRSVATVERDWARARMWLYEFLREDDDAPDPPVGGGPGSRRPPPRRWA